MSKPPALNQEGARKLLKAIMEVPSEDELDLEQGIEMTKAEIDAMVVRVLSRTQEVGRP